jgi:hypothetical protein
MEQTPSREAGSLSADQEIIRLLWDPTFYCPVHKNSPLDLVLILGSPLPTLTAYFLKINFNIILPTADLWLMQDATLSKQTLEPTQLFVQWISEVKLPKREADRTPTFNAELKNAWRFTSTPPHVFMLRCLSTRTTSYHLPLHLPSWSLPFRFSD